MPEMTKREKLVVGVPTSMRVINTPWAQVAVYGSDAVSEKDISILGLCLARPEFSADQGDHCVRTVMFRTDDRPEGLQAICVPDGQGIVVNLQAVFDKAIEEAMDDPNISLRAAYHRNLVLNFLHEIHHMVVLAGTNCVISEDEEWKAAMERDAENWALEELVSMAKFEDIEPANVAGDFFGMAFTKLLAEGGDWVEAQQRMLDNNIMYSLPESGKGKDDGMTFMSFKSVVRMMAEESDWDDPAWDKQPGEQVVKEAPPDVPAEPPASEAVIEVEAVVAEDDPFAAGKVDTDPDLDIPPGDDMGEYDPNMMDFEDGMSMMMGGETDVFSDGTQPLFDYSPGPAVAVPPPAYVPPAAGAPYENPTPQGYVADQNTAIARVYHRTGFTPEQTRDIVFGVFNKIYGHIFSQCGRLLNSDLGFSNPEAVCTKPIQLTIQEQQVVVAADVLDENGRWCPKMPTTGGLRGFIMKNTKLPAVKIYINDDGYEKVRLILPQNPAKRDGKGQYTKPALQARGGTSILYVLDGEDKPAGVTSSKFFFKCIDGRWEAC